MRVAGYNIYIYIAKIETKLPEIYIYMYYIYAGKLGDGSVRYGAEQPAVCAYSICVSVAGETKQKYTSIYEYIRLETPFFFPTAGPNLNLNLTYDFRFVVVLRARLL